MKQEQVYVKAMWEELEMEKWVKMQRGVLLGIADIQMYYYTKEQF